MAWYHAQFTSRRFGQFTPNPVSLTTLPAPGAPNAAADPAKAGVPDSLFGPNIGPVAPGPAWTSQTQPKRLVEPDELTTDTVRSWIEKSKIASTPTTTLQALTPKPNTTRRKTPRTCSNSPSTAPRQSAASTCTRTCPPAHPDAPAHGGALRVFETVVEGGFGRALRPADAAVIELGRFERVPPPASSSPAAAAGSGSGGEKGAPPTTNGAQDRRRFTPFHFRRRANHSATSNTSTTPAPVAGAALAVVDEHTADNTGGKGDEDEKGVRITIRLVALDANGRELDSPNEQTVYLVVGRLGAPHPPTSSTPAPGATPAAGEGEAQESDITDAAANANGSGEEGDTRPWVVRVVKREATIGPHTFQLHEIYGLSSAAAPAPTPAAPATTTYPPQPPADDPPERECLLCLSAPREVVLLPCRHLVACRPCAVNMVEFGAGGAIVADAGAEPEPAPAAAAPTSPTAAAAATGATGGAGEADVMSPAEGEAGESPTSPVDDNANANANGGHRKRKAKGWFCPVCRQPYTSLLRITTAPPPAPGTNDASGAATSPTSPGGAAGAGGEAAGGEGAGEEDASGNTGGILSGLRPPAFLRNLSLRAERGVPRDVEAQAGVGAAA
ncbi:RING-type domain-containing protein [Mycena sanguinolenta]|uniref:RING-type domain-containing protein n=1 Tax=Mycena sanguinolenta TaxID=230812 RepID=A0A8H7CNU0_9AGAR|nr:RING-type domain-containing protein [Mycena sanguinolenta]